MKTTFLLTFFLCSSLVFCQATAGLNYQKTGSLQGYVLFAPLFSKTTYLIDKCGKQVHSWKSNYSPGQSVYLLPNGDLLRAANDSNKIFRGGGAIEKFNWDNTLLWSYTISSTTECQHHDICPLPNGNILVLVWELKTNEESLKAGRNPEFLKSGLWSEKIIEIKPVGKNAAKIVWEWHAWDHLVQDYDSSKANYGDVTKNRQLIYLNYARTNDPDWMHFNSVTYNPALDQILVSNRNYSEIFILDHSTSSSQAAAHSGGKYNKGGDLLYRYGNPRVYKMGTKEGQVLFGQHNAHWIEKGMTGEGKIILFNNGLGRRKTDNYSSVDIIIPPVDETGNYGETERTLHEEIYSEKQNESLGGTFFSPNVSSVQRLSNGNTLICSGSTGQFLELDPAKKGVWLYVNPVSGKDKPHKGMLVNLNPVFRCTFFEPSFKGFKGKHLKPGLPIETSPEAYECMTPEEEK